jgi:hypothetical protein
MSEDGDDLERLRAIEQMLHDATGMIEEGILAMKHAAAAVVALQQECDPPDDAYETLLQVSRVHGETAISNCPIRWAGSPFEWMRQNQTKRGTWGETLLAGVLEQSGFAVDRAVDTGVDRFVNGVPVEIKTSLLSAVGNKPVYTFHRIQDKPYELLLLFGISPATAHLWVLPKAVGLERRKKRADSTVMVIAPGAPDEWIFDFGGSLADGIEVLRGNKPLHEKGQLSLF